MTPEQKIKHAILLKANSVGHIIDFGGAAITAETVDKIFSDSNEDYELQDEISGFRSGEVETNINAPFSRHYECKSVAAQMPDGSWVGWPYWYGGGKHGEPEAVEWMEDAYALDCVEEEKVVTVRTFSRPVSAA